jgi:hypothetical protein
MLLLEEKCLFGKDVVEIRLHDDLRYRLRFNDLVLYETGRKKIRGKTQAYTFKSVEQLRYDFERDVAAVGGRLGENP